jgi:hypothetical protein
MAFDAQKFLGLKVIDFSSSVGWNDAGSTLTVKMAPEDDESIAPYKIGEVKDFSFRAFNFVGFLERVIERHSSSGITYEATLSDGKEILRNVQCVVGNLYGNKDDSACLVDNYFNIFRYYEGIGYGAANSNASGMGVNTFVAGVSALSGLCGVRNGTEKYSVDISAILTGLPDYYRIPGPKVGLLDVVSQICEATGHMWRLVLEGKTFRIKIQSLALDAANQKVVGTIKTMALNKKAISWDAGSEAATGVTCNFVVWGGAKEQTILFDRGFDSYINPNSVIKYYFGHDITGTPQTKINYEVKTYRNLIGDSFTLEVMENINIPAIGIEDIEGGIYYLTNSVELQCVMGSQESWEFYLELYEPERYANIFLRGARAWDADRLYWSRFGGAGTTLLKRYFSEKENDVGVRRAARLYSYLKSYCETYWGKQFLVQVNGGGNSDLKGRSNNIGPDGETSVTGGLTVRNKLEKKLPQDTLTDEQKGTYNILPSQSGWMDPTQVGSSPFAQIPKPVFDGQFKDPKGKLENWAVILATPGTYQIDDTSPDCYVIGDHIFLKLTVSDKYVMVDGKEHIHVSLPQSVLLIGPESSRSELGNDPLSRCLFGIFNGVTQIGSSELFKVGYIPITPKLMAIGLVATTNDAYGPWYMNSGKGGLTKVEHDSSLTPWEFGSGANLGQVFSEKLKDIQPVDKFETGSLTMVNPPEHQLGDELVKNGAIVTSISASYGPNGITTQYSFRTFLPRFGVTSDVVINRMRQQTAKQNEDRRTILKSYMDTIARQQSANRSEMGGKIRSFFLDFLGRRHDRMSPHALIVMGIGIANAGPGAYFGIGMYTRTKILGASYKQNESMKDLGDKELDSVQIDSKAVASMDTLYVPFRNNFANSGGAFFSSSGYLPHCWPVTPDTLVSQKFTNSPDPQYKRGDNLIDIRQGKVPTSITYNPFKRFCHFDTLIDCNQDYWDNHNEPTKYFSSEGSVGVGSQPIDVKAIALRGPLMISGWGVDLWTGQIIPSVDYGLTDKFTPDPYVSANAPWEAAENKMTGPVDLMWDSARGMWTSHDVVRVQPSATVYGSNFTCNTSGRLSKAFVRMYANDLLSNQLVEVYNLSSKPQYPATQTLAHYSVYDNRWYIKGEGAIPRYNDLKLQAQIYASICNTIGPNPAPPPPICDYNITTGNEKSSFKYYADFDITEQTTDIYTVARLKDNGETTLCPEHKFVDVIRTHGMNAGVPYVIGVTKCPDGTIVPIINTLWFWHGLAKEIILPDEDEDECEGHEDPDDPNTTTTVGPTTTTTTAPSGYCVVETGEGTQCFNCTQYCESEFFLQGPYPKAECESYLPGLNANCSMTLVFDDPCFSCYYDANGEYTGPNKVENCNMDRDQQNANIPACTTTTTPAPCDTYYLYQNEETFCHYCSTAPNGTGGYPGTLIDGVCENGCEDARTIADSEDPRCQGCYKITGGCDQSTCYTCRSCETGESGEYTNLDDCMEQADSQNAQCSPICTTTSTTTTTSAPTTSTTTTTANPCVTVVEAVVCAPQSPGDGYVSGGGDIWTKSVSVVKCSTQPLPPAVFSSSFPNLEVKLLRAELKALTKKFVQLVDVLEKNDIKVF